MNRKSTVLLGLVCLVPLFLAVNTRAGNNGAAAFEKMKSLAGSLGRKHARRWQINRGY